MSSPSGWIESGWIDPETDPAGLELLSGPNGGWRCLKFRASFGLGPGQIQPPFLDTVVVPYQKLAAR